MRLRELFIDCLNVIEPFDDIERAAQADAINWISSGGTIVRRYKTDNPPTERHFICYFPMIDFGSKRIFLAFHRKAHMWLPPGGHIEEGETPLETTIRECHEELGIPARFIDSKPFFVSSVKTQNTPDPHFDIGFWFILISGKGEKISLDTREFAKCDWFDIDAHLPRNAEPNLPRFLQKLAKSDLYGFNQRSEELARRLTLPSLMAS